MMRLSFYILWVVEPMPLDINTKCVYIENGLDSETGAVNPPIYQSAGFSYPDPEQLEKVLRARTLVMFIHEYQIRQFLSLNVE